MGKNNEKGKKYELFSQEILLLKHYNWNYSKKEKNIIFDKISDNHKIMGNLIQKATSNKSHFKPTRRWLLGGGIVEMGFLINGFFL